MKKLRCGVWRACRFQFVSASFSNFPLFVRTFTPAFVSLDAATVISRMLPGTDARWLFMPVYTCDFSCDFDQTAYKTCHSLPHTTGFDVISRMLPGTHAKTGIQMWANSSFQHFHSQVQQVHFSITIWKKYLSEVMRISSTIIFHLSKLWKAKFFILCEVIFVVRLQEKIEIEILGNANCDAIRNGISQEKHTKQVQQTQWQLLCAIFYPICPS